MIPGDGLRELLAKWYEYFYTRWAKKQHFRAILAVLLPTVAVGLVLGLLFKGILSAGNFLWKHAAQFFCVLLAFCFFVAWLDKRKADKIKMEREEQEMRERRDYSDRLEAARTKEATYTAQAKIIFSVARELGPLGIVPPATLCSIYSPGRTIPKANGTVSLSVFLLQKDCETVDTDLFKHTAQMKIDQRLQAGEFPDIPEHHMYQGHVYSGFVIDMVRDSEGYLEVYTALVNDAYCRYRQNRELNSYRLLPSVDRRDMDY